MKSIFITGTDTGVGKTIASSFIIKAYKNLIPYLKYWKPIQTGYPPDNDSQTVKELAEISDEFILKGMYFKSPTSPHFAAEKENQLIRIEKIDELFLEYTKNYNLIIEGAGGIFVPINRYFFWIDWIQRWNLPVIIVSRSTLGTINHSLLTIEALKSRNIFILGIIFCGKHNEEYIYDNFKTIQEISNIKVISYFDLNNDKEIEIDPEKIIYSFFL